MNSTCELGGDAARALKPYPDYKPQPLRSLEEIRADILALEKETEGLLGDILNTSGSER